MKRALPLLLAAVAMTTFVACGDDDDDGNGNGNGNGDAGVTTYTLDVTGAENGGITLDPAGGEYEAGTQVTVTAVPEAGYAFEAWTGDLSGTDNPTTVTMDGDKTIGATFVAEAAEYTLTITEPENGAIELDPAGDTHAAGTTVTVTAVADEGYAFTGWTGDLSGTDNPATLTMDGDKTVGATFEAGVTVSLAPATGGTYTLDPPLEDGAVVPFGTQITIEATPDAGYVLDSAFKMMWIIAPFWAYYIEESFTSPYTLTLDPDDARFKTMGGELDEYVVGAYFLPEDTWGELEETLNVVYAEPGTKPLKYDVYAPADAAGLPMIVIIHGGGWNTNTEDIMRGQARYLAQTGRYVVASIDYRLLSDLDDPPPTMVDIVQDVFGAIAHLQEHAAEYGADPTRLAVTGDSAGGHLAALVANQSPMIGEGGYTGGPESEFLPTYVPAGKTVAQVRDEITAAVLAAAPSYGVFANEAWDVALQPLLHIPPSSERVLPPQHCQTGTEDMVVPSAGVLAYVEALQAAGHTAEYVEIEGANHAYFDWKPDAATQTTFHTIGEPALDLMLAFFDGIFQPAE